MKYLKMYEMFDDNQYYTEVSQDDVYSINDGCYVGVVEFDPTDKKALNLELSSLPIEWSSGYSIDEFGSETKYSYCVITPHTSGDMSYIYALKDYWYVIEHYDSNNNRKYYKCDRIDGLIKCLKDKSII